METPHPQRRFGGIARLYGEAGLARLGAARVAVIGTGGVGSWAVEALARSGLGELRLIDADHVAESNINRQLPALDSTRGRAKVQVLAERVSDIAPHCRVHAIEEMVDLANPAELLPTDLDYVIDCADNARVKAAVIAHCRRQHLRVITLGGAGGKTDPTRIRVNDLGRTEHDPLLARVRRELRREHGWSRNPQRRFDVPCVWSNEQSRRPAGATGLSCAGGLGSVMTVTAAFAMAAVARVLARLCDASG